MQNTFPDYPEDFEKMIKLLYLIVHYWASQRILDICHLQFHAHLMSPKFSENLEDHVGFFFLSGASKKIIYRVYFREQLLHIVYRSRKKGMFTVLLCILRTIFLHCYCLKMFAVTILSSKVFQNAKAISVEKKILKIRSIIGLFHWFHMRVLRLRRLI